MIYRRNIFKYILLSGLLAAGIFFKPLAARAEIKLNVREFTLKNGMKVLILERPASQTVAVRICFRVGSVNEHPGITGVSHILEHMLFKGTERISTRDYAKEKPVLERIHQIMDRLDTLRKTGAETAPSFSEEETKTLESELKTLQEIHQSYVIPKEISRIYQRQGAQGLNATTSYYTTSYFCELPANKLELWAWLESDRMNQPVLRGFYSERDVILEERRTRTDDNPDGALYTLFQSTVYQAHPLHWPVIGWRSDIQSLSPAKVYQYWQQYYAPNNAVAVIVGNVKADEALQLMKKYFEPIPAQPPPPEIVTVEPEQQGERRVTLEFAAEPRILIGYHTTTIGSDDDYILDVAEMILSSGRTSRFYKKLVTEKQLCLEIGASNTTGKYPGIFIISATPKDPHTAEEAEKAVAEELELLKNQPVSIVELNRAKKQLESIFLRDLRSNTGMALRLGSYEVVCSRPSRPVGWKYLLDKVDRYKSVTPEDIMNAARKYFAPHNRTVAVLVKKNNH